MKIHLVTRSGSLHGGDDVLIEMLLRYLPGFNVEVTTGPSVKDCELVHLFNFAQPGALDAAAHECIERKLPYVITCLAEDRAAYYRLMRETTENLLHGGCSLTWPGQGDLNARFAAENAEALFVSGRAEERHVAALYPNCAERIKVNMFGADSLDDVDAERPPDAEKLSSDYVLCIGRLEDRKNQLMLMRAMRDSGMQLVFACGSGTCQPEYEFACRAFAAPQAMGTNVFYNWLSPGQIKWLLEHCGVYAQPSWCELPGLATLEAARMGIEIVATCEGTSTTPEYLWNPDEENRTYWCKPYSVDSINEAVVQAQNSLHYTDPEINFKWSNFAMRTYNSYRIALLERENSE